MKRLALSMSAGVLSIAIYGLLLWMLPIEGSWATAIGGGLGSCIGIYLILKRN